MVAVASILRVPIIQHDQGCIVDYSRPCRFRRLALGRRVSSCCLPATSTSSDSNNGVSVHQVQQLAGTIYRQSQPAALQRTSERLMSEAAVPSKFRPRDQGQLLC